MFLHRLGATGGYGAVDAAGHTDYDMSGMQMTHALMPRFREAVRKT